MSSVAHVKIYALFGGTQLTQNLRAGTKYGLKDWDWASPEFAKSLPTAVWCKGLSKLSCAILESFNIICNLLSKIIHLRKSGLHIGIVVESM